MQDHPHLVSYAQNREDLYLWALVGHRTPGTYVDIGCNDERIGSVTRLFYELGWSGLNVDADAKYESGYRHRERDTFLAVGISDHAGELSLRIYPHQDGLATFDSEVMRGHETSGLEYRDIVVPVATLDHVLAENDIGVIDFLKIDVEGVEPSVLRGIDLDAKRPAVIVIEASRIDECEQILAAHRYHRIFFDGLNLYYADGDADDVNILNYAATVLHRGYETDREHELQSEVDRLRSHVEALESQLQAVPRPPGPSTVSRVVDRVTRLSSTVRSRVRV